MDPTQSLGLHNPNAYVRGGAVEALGKVYRVNSMKKVERDDIIGKARVQQYASNEASVPYTPAILTPEQQVAFDELLEDNPEEENADAEEDSGEEEPARLEEEEEDDDDDSGEEEPARLEEEEEDEEKAAVGAAAPGKVMREEAANVEKGGKDTSVGSVAAVGKPGEDKERKKPGSVAAVVDMKGKEPMAGPAAGKTGAKNPAKQQQKKNVYYHCSNLLSAC